MQHHGSSTKKQICKDDHRGLAYLYSSDSDIGPLLTDIYQAFEEASLALYLEPIQ